MKRRSFVFVGLVLVAMALMAGFTKVAKAEEPIVRVTKTDPAPDIRDGCGRHEATINTIIFTEIIDENTNKLVRYASDFKVKVSTVNSPDGWYNRPGTWDSNHNGYPDPGDEAYFSLRGVYKDNSSIRTTDKIFNSTDADTSMNFQQCDSERVVEAGLAAAPGAGGSAPGAWDKGGVKALVFQNTNDGRWIISCAWQNNHQRGYSFQGVGEPTIPAGYDRVGWGERSYATIPALNYVDGSNTSNKDQYVVVLRYKVKKTVTEGDQYSTVECAADGKSDTSVTCPIDRQTYPAAGGKPKVTYWHHFQGSNDTNLEKYDVNIPGALCLTLDPGTRCSGYAWEWQDAKPPTELKETWWDNNPAPGGPYCEQQTWVPKYRIPKPSPTPDVKWDGTPGASNQVCATVTQWSLTAGTGAFVGDVAIPNNSTAYTNQDVKMNSYVDNNGSAELDQFLDVDIKRTDIAKDSTSLDQYRGWSPESAAKVVSRPINTAGQHCENVWAAQTTYDSGPLDFPTTCIYVIDPDASAPSKIQYEKGQSNLNIGGSISVANGGVCPVSKVNIPYVAIVNGAKLGGPGETTFPYGGDAGCDTSSLTNMLTISSTLATTLNGKSPGDSGVGYSLSVNGETAKTGTIDVYEVPYARFYGGDVIARKGDIKFNADPSVATNGKGSASQYATIAKDTIDLASATFRMGMTHTPAGSGLQSKNQPATTPKTISEIIDNDIKLPDGCASSGSTSITFSGAEKQCYNVTGDATIGSEQTYVSKRVTLKASGNVVISGNVINNSPISPVATPPQPPVTDPPIVPAITPVPAGTDVVRIEHAPSYSGGFDYGAMCKQKDSGVIRKVPSGSYNNGLRSYCGLKFSFLHPGYSITVYSGSNFTGSSKTFFADSTLKNDYAFKDWQGYTEVKSYTIQFVSPPQPLATTNNISGSAPTVGVSGPAILGSLVPAAAPASPAPQTPASPASPATTMGVVLIVADTIYIDQNVTRLDAILLAKNIIYTCSNGSAPVAKARRDNDCRNNLTINGAIAAPTIKFERSAGTRFLDAEGTTSDLAGSRNIASRTVTNPNGDGLSKASEIINFPAYLYFANPYLKDTSTMLFNSITTAAPRM